jgi:hypothetical protein
MAAPEYVPPSYADQPRSSLPLPPNRRWTATRPADLKGAQPLGRGLGSPGPDQGYAYRLAPTFQDRLKLTEGEHEEDVVAGAVAIGMRRASLFGRAPVTHDLALAFNLFGFLDDAPPADLVEWRKKAFRGAHHDYWEQRAVVDRIPESTLRKKPEDVKGHTGEWKALVGATD